MSSKRDWTTEVAAWRASGKTAREFCAERGYSTTRLYWWSSQMKRVSAGEEASKPVPLARVVRKSRAAVASEVELAAIIVQVGAARVEVTAATDRAALTVALDALAESRWGAQS